MPFEPATKAELEKLSAMGKEFADLFRDYAKVAAVAPREIAESMQINGLGMIRNRMEQALKRTRALKGLFDNWQRDIDAVHAALEATAAPSQKKKKGA